MSYNGKRMKLSKNRRLPSLPNPPSRNRGGNYLSLKPGFNFFATYLLPCSPAPLPFILLLLCLLLAACERPSQSPIPITIEVDHGTRQVQTDAQTVRELLAENSIILGDLDRVNPDLNFSVRPGMTVRVIRVHEEEEREVLVIPFEQRIVINEALPPGERRLAQLGQNGEEEIITRITYEDEVEVRRVQVVKQTLIEPIEEILVVGAEKSTSEVLIEGSVAYLSGGNAWLMRDSNATRRPITTPGDLDGRVFDLASDGTSLIYTRATSTALNAPLNELWLLDTRIVGEDPISLPVQGALYAAWSPLVTETVIAYSTAERVPSQPGWRANNDLWLWDIATPISQATEIVPANTAGLYPWWGTTFAWSPNGSAFAFAKANQVGVIDVVSKTVTVLAEFAPFETRSNWVWVPTISWSPDSRFIATVLHGDPRTGETPETSSVFDVWLFSPDGKLQVKAAEEAGMWSNPAWHQAGILYGQATNPLRSVDSRYKLANMDWDGSNATVLFPLTDAPGVTLPDITWHPQGREGAFIFNYQDNLFLYQGLGLSPLPLTSDNQSHQARWMLPQEVLPPLTGTLTLTNPILLNLTNIFTAAITSTQAVTVTLPVSAPSR